MPKILAIDYGEKRVGLAAADTETLLPLPLAILDNKGMKKLIEEIMKICQKEAISEIVVGLPTGLAGKPTKQTEKTKKFIAGLKQKITLPIGEQSEIFTSRQARKMFEEAGIKKRRVDASAAVLILNDYLEKTTPLEAQN
ncbi:Holliday junction resolvase RuvX [Patescibacteria group bacterium]|nr:Holliday junction resolvase RuvX [Patescibacteria group bacterium]MBU3999583.1 Holliday junction resolvase RuvX [Patescibacteria group bacterium]MBU4056943.1 Holliday junction resolvase RuvX [Patescibacteria group bacterium]MBU4368806.1 Holliday junction resolvase RuvX [Patescibacteria group bacterium]